MKQMYVEKTRAQEPRVRKLWREGDGIYEVRSFNPRHPQLWYRVVLKPFDEICKCSCEHFKYNPGLVCKHIIKVVELENGFGH